ncbi:hypothetical protein [Neisseria polysaccharea]|uniref:Uncharacterized protein n=1 Tax=Neisseria polysaccharea TaxID=489 RepID=A0ABV1JJD5_NEIPO
MNTGTIDQALLKDIVETSNTVWERVFNSAQLILGAINKDGYDYQLVNNSIDPSVDQVLVMLKKMVSTFDSLTNILPFINADKTQIYETERVLLNSRQTVLVMEQIMLAMQANDFEACNYYKSMLDKQAII